ncbi:MAG: PFL family protein [Peptoniphilaceae bacterium]|nr:PFL family protein [Peptoniphilaceae bacterium]MDY6085769.1 PFL family protein [Peptoniphilaceae bacterium]
MNIEQLYATDHMLSQEKLDIRTVTMGISLLDCADGEGKKARQKIYDRITTNAEHLVEEVEKVGRTYGVSIANKRVSVTPISLIAGASGEEDYVAYAETLDRAGKAVGVDFIGGFSALVQQHATAADRILIDSIPRALAETDIVCASVNVGSTRAGINMDAVRRLGEVIRESAELTKDQDCIGPAKLVVFANAVEDNPFMAGAFHGASQGDCALRVGVSGPGVVKHALEAVRGEPMERVAEEIKRTAFKITRLGELIGRETSKRLDVPFTTIDLSLAPTPAIGDSVARILEEIGLSQVGTHGTTAALALLNDAVKKGGLMASSYVGGLSGAFIPVSEDEGMIAAAASGELSIDKLEAMTSVCSVGLDMIAVPGDTPASTISAIIADECAIGMINMKTTAVRLIPVIGKGVGESVTFGGLLGSAPIMPVHPGDSSAMVSRGGFIPAPVHSFKN